MKKIVLLASGDGTNFEAIVKSGIVLSKVITDNKNANVIKRAEKANIPVFVFDRKEGDYKNGFGWCERNISETIPEDTDLIVLAGYCSILSSHFCKAWAGKIVNIHPSILPAFAGTIHAIKEAWEHGCKIFGVTIHYVTEELDAGPIITQRCIHPLEGDTLETLTGKVRTVEHYAYPEAIRKILQITIK